MAFGASRRPRWGETVWHGGWTGAVCGAVAAAWLFTALTGLPLVPRAVADPLDADVGPGLVLMTIVATVAAVVGAGMGLLAGLLNGVVAACREDLVPWLAVPTAAAVTVVAAREAPNLPGLGAGGLAVLVVGAAASLVQAVLLLHWRRRLRRRWATADRYGRPGVGP